MGNRMDNRLRTLAILALVHEGYCCPNYSLDDIDPSIYYYEITNSFSVNFWDMSTNVNKDDQHFDELMEFYINNKNEFKN